MINSLKRLKFWAFTVSISLIFLGFLFETYSFSEKQRNNEEVVFKETPALIIVEDNTLFPLSNPTNPPPKVAWKMPVIVTAYSSTPWETDDSPFVTAAGTWVRDGIVANNYLYFGTKIRIPEIYGDKIFTVEDRMSWKKSNYHIDIWFSDYQKALSFGVERTHIEILEM